MSLKETEMEKTREAFLRQGPGKHTYADPKISPMPTQPVTRAPGPNLDTGLLSTLQSWEGLCALSIKVDQGRGDTVDPSLDAVLLELLDQVQRTHGAIGCRWAPGLYLCALENPDTADAQRLARDLQAQLSAQRPETITIGIASYPQINFSRGECLANTCKALDHAAFFGPGGVACFDATSLNISGDKFYHTGDMEGAAAEYRIGLQIDPQDANLHNSLGICLARQGETAAAEAAFQRSLEIDPAEGMAAYNLGVSALLREDTALALDRFYAAHDLNREFFDIPYQIGRLLVDQKKWPAALDYLETAIGRNDGHWHLFNLKGRCLAESGDRSGAIVAYSRSVKLNPGDADGLSSLACLYDECSENPEICETFFQESIRLNPENGLYHYRLGCWHQKHHKTDLAMAAYLKASALGHDASKEIASLEQSEGETKAPATRCA